MSDHVPLDEQNLEWIDSIDWTSWPTGVGMTPEALGSFDAGQSGVDSTPHYWASNDNVGPSLNYFDYGMQLLGPCTSNLAEESLSVLPTASIHQPRGVEVIAATASSTSPFIASTPAPDPAFASTSAARSFISGPTTSTNETRVQLKESNKFRCDVRGCKHKKPFSNNWERERHYQSTHGTSKPYLCQAKGCFHKQLPWAFARPDKLTSHIKSTHNRNTVFNQCPMASCAHGPVTLEELGIHIYRAHIPQPGSWSSLDIRPARAVLNATPCKVLRCPVRLCGKHMSMTVLPGHIQREHSVEQIYADSQDPKAEGFSIKQSYGMLGFTFTVSVLCPVCGADCETPELFVDHFWTHHLYLASTDGAEHFRAWRSMMAENVHSYHRTEVSKMMPWTNAAKRYLFSHRQTFECPACAFSIADVSWCSPDSEVDLVLNHHLSLLRPASEVVSELYPYRFQILRLYPEFVSHPVFADFDRKDGQGQASS